MRRFVIVGAVLALLVAMLAATWYGARSADEAARGVVAAASRRDAIELAQRTGREVSASDLELLASQAPDGLYDPILYSVSGWTLASPSSLSVTVIAPDAPQYSALVQLKWDWSSGDWTVLSIERTE